MIDRTIACLTEAGVRSDTSITTNSWMPPICLAAGPESHARSDQPADRAWIPCLRQVVFRMAVSPPKPTMKPASSASCHAGFGGRRRDSKPGTKRCTMCRCFTGLGGWDDRLLDESTILRFRHVLGKHQLAALILATLNTLLRDWGLMLKNGAAGEATLVAVPSSTQNALDEREPEMRQGKGIHDEHKKISFTYSSACADWHQHRPACNARIGRYE